MISKGYNPTQKISSTLQGSIWKGTFGQNDVVIKITNKSLHSYNIAIVNGVRHSVKENIISEMKILKHLTLHLNNTNYLNNMVKYIDFFEDINNYYLVMENGGHSLFDFAKKVNNCISSGSLSINEWKNTAKIIFKQMCNFIDILHNKMNCCHLDISLENILINDVQCKITNNNKKMISFIGDFTIKFCDFGLAEIFDVKTNPLFKCNKFVGKTNYKSPEVYKLKRNFDAKANDIWCLGICFFALLFGTMPFSKPSRKETTFRLIMDGQILLLLKNWKKLDYIDDNILDIFNKIFQNEEKRINIKQLLKHQWFTAK